MPRRRRSPALTRSPVAPYHYLCDGQLKNCVPQPGTDRRLDSQGDKIMSRLVYRKIGNRESIVGVHSVNTTAGGGGVRWYEFRLDRDRGVTLFQQGTYAPEGLFRWMASPAIDRFGNIGIGYSFGGPPHFAGQRFAGRLASDPPGVLTLRETVLVEGEDIQTAMRWQDYTQTAIDPSDDCTIWYVGDYIKKGASSVLEQDRRVSDAWLPLSGSGRAFRLQAEDPRRSAVIFACSPAATRISRAGSLPRRAVSIASISSALRPEAQTMKM